jgi:tetratricopeptide (TPR) repeat protein
VAYFELGQYQNAQEAFKLALEQESSHKESLYNLMLTENRLKAQPHKKVTPTDVGVTTHYEYSKLSLHVYYVCPPLVPPFDPTHHEVD